MSQHWSDDRAGNDQGSGGDPRDRATTPGGDRSSARLDVSVPQVAGGAMASVTAAYLGSYLGVAGTFWGAGLTSVVITVGGALYQRSLERTTDTANAAAAKAALKRAANKPLDGGVARRAAEPGREATRVIRPRSSSAPSGMHWPGGEQVVDGPGEVRSGHRRSAQQPGSREQPRSREQCWPGVDQRSRTRVLRWDGTRYVPRVEPEPRTGAVSSASSPSAATSPGTGLSPPTGASPSTGTSRRAGKFPAPRRRRVRWAALAATGALMFGLCMLVVTGFEGITGKPMSGGDGGTTVGSVFRSGPQRPDPAPAVPTAPEPSTRPSKQPEPSIRPSKQLEPSRQPGSGERSTAPRPSGTRAPTTTERPTGEPAPVPGSPTTGAGAPAGGAGERTGVGAPGAEPEIEPEIADQPGSSGTGQ